MNERKHHVLLLLIVVIILAAAFYGFVFRTGLLHDLDLVVTLFLIFSIIAGLVAVLVIKLSGEEGFDPLDSMLDTDSHRR